MKSIWRQCTEIKERNNTKIKNPYWIFFVSFLFWQFWQSLGAVPRHQVIDQWRLLHIGVWWAPLMSLKLLGSSTFSIFQTTPSCVSDIHRVRRGTVNQRSQVDVWFECFWSRKVWQCVWDLLDDLWRLWTGFTDFVWQALGGYTDFRELIFTSRIWRYVGGGIGDFDSNLRQPVSVKLVKLFGSFQEFPGGHLVTEKSPSLVLSLQLTSVAHQWQQGRV